MKKSNVRDKLNELISEDDFKKVDEKEEAHPDDLPEEDLGTEYEVGSSIKSSPVVKQVSQDLLDNILKKHMNSSNSQFWYQNEKDNADDLYKGMMINPGDYIDDWYDNEPTKSKPPTKKNKQSFDVDDLTDAMKLIYNNE